MKCHRTERSRGPQKSSARISIRDSFAFLMSRSASSFARKQSLAHLLTRSLNAYQTSGFGDTIRYTATGARKKSTLTEQATEKCNALVCKHEIYLDIPLRVASDRPSVRSLRSTLAPFRRLLTLWFYDHGQISQFVMVLEQCCCCCCRWLPQREHGRPRYPSMLRVMCKFFQ